MNNLADKIINTVNNYGLDLNKEYFIDFSFTGTDSAKQKASEMFMKLNFVNISHESKDMLVVQKAIYINQKTLSEILITLDKIISETEIKYDGWSIAL